MSQIPIVQSVKKVEFEDGIDPYTIRWGFNAVIREKYLEARECGISILPFAEWFAIMSFPGIKENHTTDDTQPKERRVTISAAYAQNYLTEHFAGKNTMLNVPDWGMQIDFNGTEDAGLMAVISRALLPDLPSIRQICTRLNLENPIGTFCPGQDDIQFDQRQTCASCWMNWLMSDACASYVTTISKEGMEVIERDQQGKEANRRVKPTIALFEKARNLMLKSFQLGIMALEKEWSNILGELDEKSRKALKEYQHGIRQDLHAAKPANRNMEVVQEYAKANAEAVAGNNVQMGEAMAMMGNALTVLADSQAKTNQVLERILDKQGAK